MLEIYRAGGLARLRELDGPAPYDAAYFDRYRSYRGSAIERELNAFRVGLARTHCKGVLDVGIGDGAFLDALGDFPRRGCDVNPAGIAWLAERGLWHDPYGGLPEGIDGVTMWDVLEHLERPGEFLGRLPDGTTLLVSIPVFTDLSRVRESKHFLPAEHRYYFTGRGFRGYMADLGFRLLESSDAETRLGRESIRTFALRKGHRKG